MPDDTKEQDRHRTSSNVAEDNLVNRRNILLGSSALVAAATLTSDALAQAQKAAPAGSAAPSGGKPNILILWGDDIGIANISAYSDGLMGYETPEHRSHRPRGHQVPALLRRTVVHRRPCGIPDRPARHSHRVDQGRLPRRADGHEPTRPLVGGLLKNLGYATGQFGKNHVGDRNESLPTVNGFDEFFGNLYHLNAEEEPELPDYPKDPAYLAKFGPRGVLEVQGYRPRRPHGRSALRQDRQADHRGYRRAHQEAHGDDRRRDLGRGHRLHEAAAGGRQAVLRAGSTRRACTCERMSAPSIAAATRTATANISTA